MTTIELERCYIAPTPPVPAASLPLTFFDVAFLYGPPDERLFFFPCPDAAADVIPNLKSSLALTLHHFFPLAGRVRLVPGSTDRHELHYADDDSVSFIVAQTDMDFNNLITNHPRKFNEIRSLVAPLREGALLAIQVTLFLGHGLSICFTLHHAACDGRSSIHFIKSWASSCKSNNGGISTPSPLFDRSLIPDPCDFYSERHKPVTRPKTTLPIDLVQSTFSLSRENINSLKELVGGRVSSFAVSCAYIWVCLVKARGYEAEKTVHFFFGADWRKRMQIPDEYFGNCLAPCIAEAKAGELVGKEGVIVAAEAIRREIVELDDLSVQLRKPSRIVRSAGGYITVTSSPQFGVYEVDFGFGRPAKVEAPSIQAISGIFVAERREGDGGVEIGIVLPAQEMDALATNFENGLKFTVSC